MVVIIDNLFMYAMCSAMHRAIMFPEAAETHVLLTETKVIPMYCYCNETLLGTKGSSKTMSPLLYVGRTVNHVSHFCSLLCHLFPTNSDFFPPMKLHFCQPGT